MLIERPKYLKMLMDARGDGQVKVLTGIRRCGKSFLLKELFKSALIREGVDPSDIIYVPLDEIEYSNLRNPFALSNYLKDKTSDSAKRYYIFLDEVQFVTPTKNPADPQGEKITFIDVALSLRQKGNLDVYLTGSNSKMLSSDILTQFRDRDTQIRVRPLSFSEFLPASGLDGEAAFSEYMLHGGMPLAVLKKDDDAKEEYLKKLFETTYFKDIIEHNKVRLQKQMGELCDFLASNIGQKTDPTKLANTFKSVERIDIGKDAISTYIDYFADAFIVEKAKRTDIKGKKYIGASAKYYFADLGLRNARLNFAHEDYGQAMENILYNELRCRGYSVDVGVVPYYYDDENGVTQKTDLEVDFVATKGSKKYYIQSAYELDTQEKIGQEEKSLLRIEDSFKKIVVVKDSKKVRRNEYGIATMGVAYFLTNLDSLDE
jgi:predicted AAA+ superfamily ATPase